MGETDAVQAVLDVLRRSQAALPARAIKQALAASGLDTVWPSAQKKIRHHPEVAYDDQAKTYRYAQPSASDAFERILRGRVPAHQKEALAQIVRKALIPAADGVAEARQRQAAIDAARTLAELAIEVEELTANQATPEVLIHRVRARVHRSGLEPIDRAGEETTFDRKRHKAIGGSIRDGAAVFVVRPGYVWKAAEEDVLIGKAVVEE